MASKFDRIQWHPFLPTLFLAYYVWRISERGLTTLGIIGGSVVLIWFLGAWYNLFSKGNLLRWFDSTDEDEDSLPEVPASFSAIEKSGVPLTPLQRAISDGLAGRKELREALRELEIESVDYERDATAICAALRDCEGNPATPWEDLVSLVDRPGSARVYRIYLQQALPIAHRIFLRDRKTADKDSAGKLLSILRLFTAYGYHPAFRDIALASRDPLFCEEYRWVSLFSNANNEDPDSLKLNLLLAKPLPKGFARIAYLDWSNQWCIEATLANHPFDSDEGVAALEELLAETDPEKTSHAVSATAAIPFLSHAKRDFLLLLARGHADPDVRLESAWAAARLKMPEGVRDLAAATLDWKTGAKAKRYMEELGLNDEIPAHALDPKHDALCEMARWLAHPCELGRFPDSLTIVDQRELHWPATGKRELQTLLHWKLADDEGISFTGSCTWALFSCAEPDMPLLDLYAMYNSWQMQANKLPDAPESFSDLESGRAILIRANPDMEW